VWIVRGGLLELAVGSGRRGWRPARPGCSACWAARWSSRPPGCWWRRPATKWCRCRSGPWPRCKET